MPVTSWGVYLLTLCGRSPRLTSVEHVRLRSATFWSRQSRFFEHLPLGAWTRGLSERVSPLCLCVSALLSPPLRAALVHRGHGSGDHGGRRPLRLRSGTDDWPASTGCHVAALRLCGTMAFSSLSMRRCVFSRSHKACARSQ